jgi:hypothetical protein
MASKFRSEPSTAPTTSAESTTRAEPRAKSLPLVQGDAREATQVPARMVNEVLYCERLFYLEWVQGEWAGNVFTADGDRVHKRVDAGKRKLGPSPKEAQEEKPYQARSVWLSSKRLGLTAKLDVVDVGAQVIQAPPCCPTRRDGAPEPSLEPSQRVEVERTTPLLVPLERRPLC